MLTNVIHLISYMTFFNLQIILKWFVDFQEVHDHMNCKFNDICKHLLFIFKYIYFLNVMFKKFISKH